MPLSGVRDEPFRFSPSIWMTSLSMTNSFFTFKWTNSTYLNKVLGQLVANWDDPVTQADLGFWVRLDIQPMEEYK